ncbi:hypothetical protein COM46_13490 [Bacillus pseudomycoides]|uniref:BppU family phage baseplate upper protein n=1 Tax=Bacillus pseudomycoides TaxID=64104 RepID=UPI000BF520F6|nr:BppU family phage baseplate upper protein [Bacillus pseudomycoides]PGD75959.1 hypothetical protein COM46_13490 [Bacillus pseudomycoides]
MTFKTYEINIDLINIPSSPATVRFSQNDQNSAKLLLNITNKTVEVDLSLAKSVKISFKKPDGTRVFQDDCQPINALKGKYQVILKTQTLTAIGNVMGQVQIEEDNRIIETQKFWFVVDESLMSDGAIESTNEFGVIQQVIDVGKQLEGVDIPALIASKETAEEAKAAVTENATQIGILSSNVSTTKDEAKQAKTTADNLVSRVDNLVGNTGSSNTEIVDMRNDARGVTYTTAKQRVDAIQVMAEKNKVYASFPPLPNLYDTANKLVLLANDATKWVTKLQVTTDSTIKYEGQNTVKFDHAVGQGSPYGNYDLAAPVDFTNVDYIELILYVTGGNNVGANSNLRLYSGTAGSFKADMYRYVNSSTGQKEGWKRIRINKSEFTINDGAPTWNNITKVFLSFTISSSAIASVNLAKISTRNVQAGILNIDFDDSLISTYKNAFPIMEKYNLKGNIYVITSRVGTPGYMTWGELQECRQAGWTIGSHTDLHQNIANLTREQIIKEFDDSQRKLRNHGFYSGSYFFAAPLGGWSDVAREEALKRFIYARVYRQIPALDSVPVDDPLLSGYRSVEKTDTLDKVKGEIDNIITKKLAYNMTFHDIEATIPGTYNWPLTDFESLCQYIAEKRDSGQLMVLTAEEKILQFAGVESNFHGKHSVLTSDQEGTVILKLNRN